MSNIGSAINTALRALEANQLALAVASNNIANANTPGYTRETVAMRPAANSGGTFPVGNGVEVLGIQAVRDRLIESRLTEALSRQAESDTTHTALGDVEMLFNESGDSGMGKLLTNFFNDFHALSVDPASQVARRQLATSAGAVTDFLHSRATELKSVQTALNRSVNDDVSEINRLSQQIAETTGRIAEQETFQPAHELRDQRQNLVQQLSKLASVRESEMNGTYQLRIGSDNRPLVVDTRVMALTAQPSPSGSTRVMSGGDDITDKISGGRLGANATMANATVPKYLDQLDQLAYGIAEQVNILHRGAYDLDGNTGNDFFTPLTTVSGAARNISVSAGITGDLRKIAASSDPGGTDNQAAIAMGNLLHQSVFADGSILDRYQAIVYTVGGDTEKSRQTTEQNDTLVLQMENRRQEVSGVSIDEEAIKILQFQRAYEASARVIRTMDQLLEVTLTLGA